SPSFSEFPVPPREESVAEVAELWEGDTYAPFVAERDGRISGMLILFRRPEGDLRVPARNIDLAFAATHEEFRGSGAGMALYAQAMDWAGEQGFESMTVDWRSVNLLSSRFWPNRGFRAQYLRLYRAIP
ncbi:MAG TPA: GNAT family N-acetyltransferase, partial [Gaiellaceae bacterium]|nr:GNAT family N-acetyltransferase [Gaiellaceae bacterium]